MKNLIAELLVKLAQKEEESKELIAQVEALPFSDDAKEHILYNNAKTFYEQL